MTKLLTTVAVLAALTAPAVAFNETDTSVAGMIVYNSSCGKLPPKVMQFAYSHFSSHSDDVLEAMREYFDELQAKYQTKQEMMTAWCSFMKKTMPKL